MRSMAFLGGLLIAALGLSWARSIAHVPSPRETAPPVQPPPLVAEPPVVEHEAKPPVSPATRYVALSTEACLAELDARHVPYAQVDRPAVDTPVRLVGELSGVRFRTLLSKEERERSPYEIYDCRLVLALDDFAKILRSHDVVDVMLFSAFRPLVPGVVRRGHESALAIDVAYLGRSDGSAYSILRDFMPVAKEHPCTSRIRAKGPRELRAIVCEAAAQEIFHVALTPDHDAAHRDHFHLEIVPGEARSIVD